jgi:hypothetical protein
MLGWERMVAAAIIVWICELRVISGAYCVTCVELSPHPLFMFGELKTASLLQKLRTNKATTLDAHSVMHPNLYYIPSHPTLPSPTSLIKPHRPSPHHYMIAFCPHFSLQVVCCATLNGASALKINAGAVEVGRLADLIAIDCRFEGG